MKKFDVYGIGNALVDHEYMVSDEVLSDLRIDKGHMTLVDHQRLQDLLRALSEYDVGQGAGGSAANTMYAVRGFGGWPFYTCRTAPDAFGRYFIETMQSVGVETTGSDPSASGSTGCCLVLVTPDGERTMNTYLGVSGDVSRDSLSIPALQASRYLYLEGYLASSRIGAQTAIDARLHAEELGISTSVTLSDVNVIRSSRARLAKMLGNGVDIIFCNEEEALTWSRTDRLDIATKELSDIAPELLVTLGAKGCLLFHERRSVSIRTNEVQPVDANGAGDMFAGAFLACKSKDLASTTSAKFANQAAARTVQILGPRLASLQEYQKLWTTFMMSV